MFNLSKIGQVKFCKGIHLSSVSSSHQCWKISNHFMFLLFVRRSYKIKFLNLVLFEILTSPLRVFLSICCSLLYIMFGFYFKSKNASCQYVHEVFHFNIPILKQKVLVTPINHLQELEPISNFSCFYKLGLFRNFINFYN
jgi:hypothetical protein